MRTAISLIYGFLHLGEKRVLTILVTRDPEQDIEVTRIIDPRTAVPAHYSEYTFFESPQKTSSGRAASRFKAL